MAEIPPPLKEEVEMEPSISTPLQQETKRKRLQSNETDSSSSRRKKPRKKIYRPKVIGEGRRRKNSKTPTKSPKKVVVTPKPKTPRKDTPKSRTRKLPVVSKTDCSEIGTNLVDVMVSCGDIVLVGSELGSEVAGIEGKEPEEDGLKSVVIRTAVGLAESRCGGFCELGSDKAGVEVAGIEARDKAEDDDLGSMFIQTPVGFSERPWGGFCELGSDKAGVEVAGIEAKEAEEDDSASMFIQTPVGFTERPRGGFYELESDKYGVEVAGIVAKNKAEDDNSTSMFIQTPVGFTEWPRGGFCELESDEAIADVAGIEAKDKAEEVNLKSMVIQTAVGLTDRLRGGFCGVSNIPQDCKRKRSSPLKRLMKITERKPYGSRKKLLPFFFSQRKRSQMVRRRSNLASLFALPVCNQLLTKKPETIPIVGWLLKKPNQFRHRKKSQANCNSRDDDEATKPKEIDCRSPSSLNSNDRDASMETTTTDVYNEGTLTKGSAQTTLSLPSSKFSDMRSEGALSKMGNLSHTEKLNYDEGTKPKGFDCQSSSSLKSNDRDVSVVTAITNVYNEGTLAKGSVQTVLSPASSMFSVMRSEGALPKMGSLSHNEEGTKPKELDCQCPSGLKSNDRDASVVTATTDVSNAGTLTKESAQTTPSPASSKFSDTRSEETLRKMGSFSHSEKLSHNEKITMKWLDIRHFSTNLKLFNRRNEKIPREQARLLPRIIPGFHHVGSGRTLIRQQDSTLSARPSGNANHTRTALNLILWNKSGGTTRDNREHVGFTGQTRAINKGIPEGKANSSGKMLLVPYAADGRYSEAQFRNHPTYIGTNNSTGLSHDNLQKEGTDWGNEKQIIPYARKGGKKTGKGEHNPSSVQGMQGAIVPHPKSLNSTKKKELGRVDLDLRDIAMWKLVVQDESNFSNRKTDADSDKWWENEREIFRGRIDAFNAMMHVILGDRRFSPWKGSVVDSVVGVFLTQNVSDHLSSSAYMSLAATFPLQETRNHTENYQAEEIFCIEQSTQRSENFLLCESKWNNGSKLESEKTIGDPEESKEQITVNDAISSQDFVGSSVKESRDETLLLSSTCLEYDSGTCLSTNLDGRDNTMLHSYKSTFVQEPYVNSQSSTSSCECNQENKVLESEEVDCRNHIDTMDLLRSFERCSISSECISKTKSGLENNIEGSNRCKGTKEVDLPFTQNEKSQRFIDSVGKFQSQEIQLDGDVECRLYTECSNQTKKGGIQKTTEIYNYYQEKMDVGSQLSPIDVEKVERQESVVEASDNTNDTKEKEKKGAQKHMEGRDSNGFNDEKETEISKGKDKKSKMKPEIDWNRLREKWESMRRANTSCEPRSVDHMDSVDWEAVRSADPLKIADAIKERGQHNIIARRIKEFLDRIARMHGCIDLEWLRKAPANDVKEYLLEIDGLGLKSVECIRLLALQKVAFPVDINVGRIAVRLGWVPLEPLPDEVQMHLLDSFPMMDSIQKYLWPRLCTLDQRTLYELHYQLITFGKVFCTKRNPNCNACPLRADCRHYASALSSSKLALPGLPEKRIVSTMVPDKSFEGTVPTMNLAPVLPIEGNQFSESEYQTNKFEPIIEVPQSPEPAYDESQLTDIEDLCEYDSDDVPVIRLSSGRFATTSQNCLDDNVTRALVPLHTRVASIPMPKLKHIDRLRTEHQAYELPDDHPLLAELERREPNDPCPYLLCILSPGETIDSSEPPNTNCSHQKLGELCTEGSCSSCNIVREQKAGTVRGTILIPCRTAMRGKFPLNGTYFQVNEVFADDESSKSPIHVPREWIWDLPRRITYFGTSTTTIFRGLGKEDIQYCFQKGFICVRGFDRRTGIPKRLAERLHKSSHASVKARVNKSKDQKQKPCASNSNLPQQF